MSVFIGGKFAFRWKESASAVVFFFCIAAHFLIEMCVLAVLSIVLVFLCYYVYMRWLN